MIWLNNVSKTFSDAKQAALRNVTLHVEAGQLCFLIGESGAGKTTLLRLIHRDFKPDSGTVFVNGRDIAALKPKELSGYRRRVGIVFEDNRLLWERTVYQNVAIAGMITQNSARRVSAITVRALQLAKIADKFDRMPAMLSGGEQQRVGIARAIAQNPELMLADEPTKHLDAQSAGEIMRLLERVNQMLGTTMLIATHDMAAIKDMAYPKIKLVKGSITEEITLW